MNGRQGILIAWYRPLILIVFACATLFNVRVYIHSVLENKMEGTPDYLAPHASVDLFKQQASMNPVRLVLGSGGSPFVWLTLGQPVFFLTGFQADLLPVLLWEVMIEDLFLGSMFWFAVSSLWLKLSRRRFDLARAP